MEPLEIRSLLSTVGLEVVPSPVNEGSSTTLTGTLADASHAHSVVIDWGDGNTSSLKVPADQAIFTQDHTYADNLPLDAPYTIGVKVTDPDSTSFQANAEVVVKNVAPVADVAGPADGVRGQPRTLTLNATDASSKDQEAGFEFTVNWGDGSPAVTASGLSGTTVDHAFSEVGTYTVAVTAKDKDGGLSAVNAHTIAITAVGVQDDPLYPGGKLLAVGGTAANDSIVFNPGGRGRGVKVLINGQSQGSFQAITRIAAFGQDGDDNIQISGALKMAAWLDGGAGNDRLHGSAGADLLFGGLGSDRLLGGRGRDILVGGTSEDRLNGNEGDDILIGGSLKLNDAALRDTMNVWTSESLSYKDRVAALEATMNTAVQNDGERDELAGASGRNWYFEDLGQPRPKGPGPKAGHPGKPK